jgi:periplasmic protein TonB
MVVLKKVIFSLIALLLMNVTSNAATPKRDMGETDGYLAFAEQMPAPTGGIQEIYKKIVYPKLAKDAGIEGKVYVLAFVNENGGVDDVKILKGIGAGCEEAVVEALKKSSFEPGRHQGQPVKVKLSLSFVFKLNY